MAGELGVAPWLPGEWESKFGYGSSPASVAAQRPGKAALLATLKDANRRLGSALQEKGEAALAEPLPDESLRSVLPTLGHALVQFIAAHTAYHAGQLAAWRRAIGRPSAGVFL
jgi:uncharacterized damage-inducible protein DinB